MKEEKNSDIFPRHFFWGASTSAHQVEGGNHNQWTVWELENASRLAQTAHIRLGWLPTWDKAKVFAEEPANYVSGQGVDHYRRYEEDFDILKDLNLNSFRFSIEWSRIEPEEGKWNKDEIKHYKKYIAELRRRKIEPFLNLWHWTLPIWFEEKGGFEKKANLKYFDRFVKKVSDELLDDVTYVLTINEPTNYAVFGYFLGEWPPGKKSALSYIKVLWNLKQAHKRAYTIIKKSKPSVQVGAAAILANIQAKHPRSILDTISTRIMRYFWNWWFLRRIRKHQDYIGLNYYFSDYYTGLGKRDNPSIPSTDLGWYAEPEGLYPIVLRTWSKFKKPIFISETGIADAADEQRRWWIQENIVAMERALSEGVDLRGYMHWSLLDNFEWAYGWWPRFGLVKVDREKGMKRTIRPSAKWLRDWIVKLDS